MAVAGTPEREDREVELARTHGVAKRFGAVEAVRGVSCAFRSREIHAVCGENGAGKSTLLKLVAGMTAPDAGEVVVGGRPLDPHTSREAIRRGVAMVLQHFALVPAFTVLENIVLGAEPTRAFGVLDLGAARARAEAIARDLGVELRLDARIEGLGIGDRQRTEIARALFRDARLLILDEPTAVLTKAEAEALYATLRRLADRGKGVVVVTHKLDEVRAHADVVSVMRRGELVFTRPLDRAGGVDAQIEAVTAAIMGAAARARPPARRAGVEDRPARAAGGEETERGGAPAPEPDAVLVMTDVDAGRGLRSASLTVHAREIVGVAGVEGNGQKELVALLAGDLAPTRGTVAAGPTAIIREDRQSEGLVLDAPLRDNLVLGELGRFTRRGVLDLIALEWEARRRLERSGAVRGAPAAPARVEVGASSASGEGAERGGGASAGDETAAALDRPARTLSGGNQQKLVVARALARDASVIVAAQPTRGVDLAASLDIHADLAAAAERGAGVLVISADLDELRRLASRIVVLARGRIVGELPPTASDDELGRLMLGVAAPPATSDARAPTDVANARGSGP